ncbi:MAG: hypothetical protein WCP01_03790 [Methylococcaceae bacterium]
MPVTITCDDKDHLSWCIPSELPEGIQGLIDGELANVSRDTFRYTYDSTGGEIHGLSSKQLKRIKNILMKVL